MGLQFSDTSNLQGLLQDTNFWLGLDTADTTTFPTNDKVRAINAAYRKAIWIIRENEGAWVWDDSNHTDLPYFRTDVVTGQDDYSLPTGYATVERVEVKNSAGDWSVLELWNQNDVPTALEEYYESNGLPQIAVKFANSIRLFPAADRTSSDGDSLRVYTSRDMDPFTSADTTQEPGFHQNYHRYLSISAAYDFAVANDMQDKAEQLKLLMLEYEQGLAHHYANRNQQKNKVTPIIKNSNQFM